LNTLETALKLALDAHAGLTDKAGKPYILHTLRVMLQMTDEVEMIAAVLHDAIEDSKLTLQDLRKSDIPEEAIAALSVLTKSKNIEYDKYISEVKQNRLAVKIKIADLEDNLKVLRLNSIKEDDIVRIKKYHRFYKELVSME